MIDKEKHHALLVAILKEIYADKEISSILGFKGGTAAYLFYDLPRFSVDLDFDMLVSDEKTEKIVFEKVGNIVKKYGKVIDMAVKRFTLYFAINYEQGNQRLKVEISRKQSSSSFLSKDYFGIPINVMIPEDVFANKLLAMEQRKKPMNRDIFDVNYFLQKSFPVNEELIKEQSGKSLVEYLPDCIKRVETASNNQILHGIGELVENDQKVWIKNNLKKDTIVLLKIKLELAKKYG